MYRRNRILLIALIVDLVQLVAVLLWLGITNLNDEDKNLWKYCIWFLVSIVVAWVFVLSMKREDNYE